MDALDLVYTDVLDFLFPDVLAIFLLAFMLGWLLLRQIKRWSHNSRERGID